MDKRKFKIKSDETNHILSTFERDPKWSMSYCENILLSDLFNHKILNHVKIDGVNIYFSKTLEFINFIKKKKSKFNNLSLIHI